MPKFYVTSGQFREIITAEDGEGAALAALDRFLQPHAWVMDATELSDSDRRAHFAVETLTHMDAELRVSEVGFNSLLATESFLTADLLDFHFRMAVALRRFAAMFDHEYAEGGRELEIARA
jgi:hypothetical protein